MADTTIRLKALDGTWETCGVDRVPAVVPESVVLDSDDWGNKGARFDLKRDPSQVWPDISAFTPVKIDVDGSPSWSGRVSETPSRDGTDMVMSVACEGIQHHLDDDLVERKYVHTKLGDYRDARSYLTTPLANFTAVGQVQASDGAIVIGWAKGAAPAAGEAVGVVLDLGPSSTAKRMVVTFANSGFTGTDFGLYGKGVDDPSVIISGGNTAFTVNPNGGSSPQAGTLSTANRYVALLLYRSAGAGAIAADFQVRVTGIQVFADTAYESSNASALKAPTVIKDFLTRCCPLLSTDQASVDPGNTVSFNLPSFAPGEPITARDGWQAVNAFHGWMSKIDVDGRPVFQAVPSRPKYQIGEWSAAEITDSSQNSGQDIYNKVIVTGTDPAGQPVRVTRTAAQGASSPVTQAQTDITFTNPSFDTNTTGWSITTSGTITRTTTAGEFESTPAGAKLFEVISTSAAATTLTGTAKASRTYVLTCRVKTSDAVAYPVRLGIGATTLEANQNFVTQNVNSSGFVTLTKYWTPTANTASPVVVIENGNANKTAYIDTFDIRVATPTLPERRGFARAKQLAVNSVLPSDGVAAAAIGDVWLQNHITTPFRGSVVLTGKDALRNRLTGQSVPLAALLRDTGELLELTDRSDPDTGATTRKGRITTVSYVPALDQATVALDSTRANLDNLLNRLAATG